MTFSGDFTCDAINSAYRQQNLNQRGFFSGLTQEAMNAITNKKSVVGDRLLIEQRRNLKSCPRQRQMLWHKVASHFVLQGQKLIVGIKGIRKKQESIQGLEYAMKERMINPNDIRWSPLGYKSIIRSFPQVVLVNSKVDGSLQIKFLRNAKIKH